MNLPVLITLICFLYVALPAHTQVLPASFLSPTNTAEHPPLNNMVGIIFMSADNGVTWKNASAGLPDDAQIGLGAIATSETTLAVMVKQYGLYHFDFTHHRWNSMPTSPDIIKANPAAMVFYRKSVYVGTQSAGVFFSADQGKHWKNISTGLTNNTIRRFLEINGQLYVGTNAGLFSYDEVNKQWHPEYGNNTMQVNGIASGNGYIYIGTSQGVFSTAIAKKNWKPVLTERSLHNISVIGNTVYAMTYNELFSSTDDGTTWKSMQKGMPQDFYTFNVIASQGEIFAGQWDGIYRRDRESQEWTNYGAGLPEKFAFTNMKVYKGMIIISGSEGKRLN